MSCNYLTMKIGLITHSRIHTHTYRGYFTNLQIDINILNGEVNFGGCALSLRLYCFGLR